MARQDDILKNFLKHEIIKEKYEINDEEIPETVNEALNSQIPIIKAIGVIVHNMETSIQSENQIYKSLTQYLNSVAI